jgi:putative membrane protein
MMVAGLVLAWSWHPGTIILLLAMSLLYALGLWRARLRSPEDTSIKARHSCAFFLAILLAALMLLTPIDAIGRTQLFSVHMMQAIVLTTVCAPLILFASPAALLRPLIELPLLRVVVRLLTMPLVATLIFNGAFLFWHVPKVFELAQRNPTLYQVQMLTIFLASLLNWWPLIGSLREEINRMTYPIQMLYAFFDGQPVDIFAFVLVFSGVAIYRLYSIPPQLNLTAFADQTVAGALLLIPGLVDLGVMTPLFFRWLSQVEDRTRTADQRRQEEVYDEDEYEEYEEEEEGEEASK